MIGVVGGDLALDEVEADSKVELHGGHIGALVDHLGGEAPADLYGAKEHIVVRVALGQRRNGHHLWNGAEVEQLLVVQAAHVRQTVGYVCQCVRDEIIEAIHWETRC